MTTHSQPRIAINDEMPVLVDLAAFARALPGCNVSTADGIRQEVPARVVVNAARRALNRFTAQSQPYAIASLLRSIGERQLRRDPGATMQIAVLAA